MNNLSWFLYFSEILPNLAFAICNVSVILAFILFIFCIALGLSLQDYPENKSYFKTSITFFIISIIIGVFTTLVPSRQTMLLIASSELSEQVVNSGDGKEIIDNLKQILRELTTPTKGIKSND